MPSKARRSRLLMSRYELFWAKDYKLSRPFNLSESQRSPPLQNRVEQRACNARKSEGKRGRCSACQQDHYIMFCDAYKSKSAVERKQQASRPLTYAATAWKSTRQTSARQEGRAVRNITRHCTTRMSDRRLPRTSRATHRRLQAPFCSQRLAFASRIVTGFRTRLVPWWTWAPNPH